MKLERNILAIITRLMKSKSKAFIDFDSTVRIETWRISLLREHQKQNKRA